MIAPTPVCFEPARLVDGRCRRDDHRSPLSDAVEERLRRQPEMKAHDGRLELRQHVGGVVIEGCASRPRPDGRQVDAKLAIVRREQVTPSGLAVSVCCRRCVAKEIDVVRIGCGRRDGRDLVAKGIRRQHRGGKRPETAGIRYRNRQSAALRAGHWRLNERVSHSEQ